MYNIEGFRKKLSFSTIKNIFMDSNNRGNCYVDVVSCQIDKHKQILFYKCQRVWTSLSENTLKTDFSVYCTHSYYWPSHFAYTKVPESDYSEKSQKTLGVFGNFSVIY